MSAIRIALAIGAISTLSGCMSVQERRYADEQTCRGYGFRPGAEAFGKCLQNIDLDRSADRRATLYGSGIGFRGGFGYGFGGRRGW